MKAKITLLVGLFSFIFQDITAQLDTKHYMPPFFAKVEDNSGTQNIRTHFVSLSTPSEEFIPITIRNGFGELIDIVEISKDAPAEFIFSPQGNATGNPATSVYPLNVISRDSLNLPIRSQGLYFESFKPFFVNMRHKSGSQGTSLTSKGRTALGQRFYSGHLYTIYNTTADLNWNASRRSHFISVMATEDNTTVTFDLIKDPIYYIGQTPGEPITVTLDAFESYVIGIDHAEFDDSSINDANGTRITSDKPIACNTGSWLSGNQDGQCIGSDQIVPAEVTGQEYILVRGLGDESTERPMVIATEDETEVFINGNAIAAAVLDEGEYYIIPTADFTANDNLYILASEKVYVYQTLSGSSTNIGPTVGLNFIPPLNCIGAKEVILPFVNSLAAGTGQGRINIITKAGTSIYVNESPTALTGAQTVSGINDWVTYAFDPPSNNVIIESDSVMNVALLTRDDNVGTAGYFSGFTLEPVVGLSPGISGTTPCIPGNAILEVFGFDTYQWYLNNEPIAGATSNTLIPEFTGDYSVDGIDLTCGFIFRSNQFDIPFCDSELGVAKSAQSVEETSEGSRVFDISYRIFIENFNPNSAPNIQVIENINALLPVGATAELISDPVLVFGILSGSVNPSFDGVTDKRLLTGSGILPGGGIEAIDLTVRIDMNNAEQDGYINQVTATGKNGVTNDGLSGPFNGQDLSDDGFDPDPDGNGNPNEEGENTPTLTCFFSHEITYDAVNFCTSSNPVEVTIDGINTGEFSVDSEGLEINAVTGTITPGQSEAGTYTVTFTTEGRCPKQTSTEVTIAPLPTIGTVVSGTQICITETGFMLSDLIDGEDENGSWTDSDGDVIPTEFDPAIPGDFVFTYTINNEPCAPQSQTVLLTVVSEPQPGTAVANADICEDQKQANLFDYLEGEQPNGQWSDADDNNINPDIDVLSSGSFEYTYTLSNLACGERSSEVVLNINALPNAGNALLDAVYCAGQEVTLFELLVDADPNGQWMDENGEDLDDEITIGSPGEYNYTYTASNPPCPDTSTAVIFDVVQGPNAGTASDIVLICSEDVAFNLLSLLDGADKAGVFRDADGNEVSSFFVPGPVGIFEFTYTVASLDCGEISTAIQINVSDGNCTDRVLVIPEGFSPNGDGIGDTWVIGALDQYPDNRVVIFSRWGTEIFTAKPYLNNWNGTAQQGLNAGAEVPVGTYWYILDLGDGSDVRKGYVYINR